MIEAPFTLNGDALPIIPGGRSERFFESPDKRNGSGIPYLVGDILDGIIAFMQKLPGILHSDPNQKIDKAFAKFFFKQLAQILSAYPEFIV
jgi:hypothetical protein